MANVATDWIGGCMVTVLVFSAMPALAQAMPFERIFDHSDDRGELRETMRREHRERSERGSNAGFGPADAVDRSEQSRDADIPARRARWQRLSPDERQQLRRDVHQAGRDIYPRSARRDGN